MRRLVRIGVMVLTVLATTVPANAEIVIGLFSDGGTTCSFSGNSSGLITAHVVVRSYGDGIRGVRFAAPIPACFHATWVQDILPYGMYSIGDSQTGISIALPDCDGYPVNVLDIQYLADGTTTPCCPFPIVAESTVGYLEAVDCAYNSVVMTAKTSYFNSDETCPCSVDEQAPNTPYNPVPDDGANYVDVAPDLRWSATDPNGLPIVCDLYLGTDADPPLREANLGGTITWDYRPGRLLGTTTYYWRVVARNSGGAETSGPVWHFTTAANRAPAVYLTSPIDGTTGLPLTPILAWTGTGDSPLTYDVYLGTTTSPPKVSTGQTSSVYTPATLAYQTTYWWRVEGHDIYGGTGSSSTWSFTTRAVNEPPAVPYSPSPANGASNVGLNVTLSWQCTDPDGQAITYDIYFGTAADPPLRASNRSSKSYLVTSLQLDTPYYWRIVARDSGGLTANGPTWTFTTRSNLPPAAPFNPAPSNGYVGASVTTGLAWGCTDPDGQPLTFDVYWGTSNPPPLVATNIETHSATYSYNPGLQSYLTMYYWRIVARDPFGAETSGPTWHYTTKGVDDPPTVPAVIQPGNGTTGLPINISLRWNATDPESQPLTFDLYFGTDAAPPLVADHIAVMTYTPGLLATSTDYNWRVVARDPAGQETSGPVWTFRTSSTSNLPPYIPSNPNPPNGGTTGINPLLSWQGGDPDGDVVTYSVMMFTWDTFPDLLGTTTSTSFQTTNLYSGIYPWFIIANDGHWSVTGPMWTLAISGGGLPVAFQSFDAVQAGASVEIRWELSLDGAPASYRLFRGEGTGARIEITRGDVGDAKGRYVDDSVQPGKTYAYQLLVQDSKGDDYRSTVATVAMAALELTLHQNIPNPFNPQTTIRYDLPSPEHVRLSIFEVSGRLVRTLVDEDQGGGAHEVVWTGRDDNGRAASSGVYFYVLEAGKQRLTRKLVLLK
ncbi:MAG TPA: FlgD immunoglobulin-like domain containing protein [Candidatus Krumholzibacteria bacterium]|nr:FlgD immunoglobulin-like domain containing protein [Candidatus Krumholzibacteria bacterium]